MRNRFKLNINGLYLGNSYQKCRHSTEGNCKRGNHDLYEEYRYNSGQFIIIVVLACRYCDYKTTRQERSQ